MPYIILTLFTLLSLQSWGQSITTEILTLDQNLPSDTELQKKFLEEDQMKKIVPAIEPSPKDKKVEFHPGLGVHVGFGIPSVVTYGLQYFNGYNKDIVIALQGGEGQLEGSASYRDRYKELIFLANRTNPAEDWERYYGLGLGQQEFEVETSYNDKDGFYYNEKESISKTYLKFLFSVNFFKTNHLYYGADFGISMPLNIESTYFANDAVSAPNLQTGSYKEIQNNFKLFKSLFGTGISFQVTFFRWGWVF